MEELQRRIDNIQSLQRHDLQCTAVCGGKAKCEKNDNRIIEMTDELRMEVKMTRMTKR